MSRNIYEQIFDITLENMNNAGEDFTHKKSAFMAYTENDPHKTDLIELFNIRAETNIDFLEIAYIYILNRPIDSEALENWKKYSDMKPKAFRRLVIKRLVTSEEADICHKRFYNDIFSDGRAERTPTLKEKAINKVMPVYKKLPEKIKSPIRNIIKGEIK